MPVSNPGKRDRRHAIDRYAARVVEGRVPAGQYHRLACARHLRDRAREGTRGFPYRLDLARADRFLAFGQLLRHYKGQWAGQQIRWQPHQVFRLGSLFGWVHDDSGLRRFRHSYNELPRKNGKSLEGAVVALYTTFFDGEPGAEGYCAATKKDQARIVFGDAKRLVQTSGLSERIAVLVSNLYRESSASKLEPLGADEDSLDGLNPHFLNFDEIHKYRSRAMLDVLETATGARRQPVIFKITTAGDDLFTACGAEHIYACNILEGTLTDETYFAFIAHVDAEDDWTTLAAARKANPNFGVSVNPSDLRDKIVKARGIPGAAAAYQQKHLNRWINASQTWLSVDGWHKGQSQWEAESLRGRPCFVGIDLAAKLDLMAMVALFPPAAGSSERWRCLRWIWTPAETLPERAHRDRAPYPEWVASGHLRTTPGTRIDHAVIRAALADLRARAVILRVGFDPWHADQLIEQLVKADGFGPDQVVEVAQTYHGMSSGCLRLEAAVLAGELDAQGDPVMAWAVGNAVVQRDGKDNIYPVKKRSRGRIDPVVALAIAFSLAARPAPAPPQYRVVVLGGPPL
jgi:phage terminase large subunit-like protein